MKKIEYSVIILNYNTYDDTVIAIESVINNAICDDYVICMVDNNSSKDIDKLKQLNYSHLDKLFLSENQGYAIGNNKGIEYTNTKYSPNYIVIMNPDVKILTKGTIENLIREIKTYGNNVCGIIPLIWSVKESNNPFTQITAFSAPNYKKFFIQSGGIFKFIFKNTYKKLTYLDHIPYQENFFAEAVSGAFFIVKTKNFKEIGYFDNRTFLYGEERIIGYKFKNMGKSFVVCPKYIVQHECGNSTGKVFKKISYKSYKRHLESDIIYIRDILKESRIKIIVWQLYSYINFLLKKCYYFYKNNF